MLFSQIVLALAASVAAAPASQSFSVDGENDMGALIARQIDSIVASYPELHTRDSSSSAASGVSADTQAELLAAIQSTLEKYGLSGTLALGGNNNNKRKNKRDNSAYTLSPQVSAQLGKELDSAVKTILASKGITFTTPDLVSRDIGSLGSVSPADITASVITNPHPRVVHTSKNLLFSKKAKRGLEQHQQIGRDAAQRTAEQAVYDLQSHIVDMVLKSLSQADDSSNGAPVSDQGVGIKVGSGHQKRAVVSPSQFNAIQSQLQSEVQTAVQGALSAANAASGLVMSDGLPAATTDAVNGLISGFVQQVLQAVGVAQPASSSVASPAPVDAALPASVVVGPSASINMGHYAASIVQNIGIPISSTTSDVVVPSITGVPDSAVEDSLRYLGFDRHVPISVTVTTSALPSAAAPSIAALAGAVVPNKGGAVSVAASTGADGAGPQPSQQAAPVGVIPDIALPSTVVDPSQLASQLDIGNPTDALQSALPDLPAVAQIVSDLLQNSQPSAEPNSQPSQALLLPSLPAIDPAALLPAIPSIPLPVALPSIAPSVALPIPPLGVPSIVPSLSLPIVPPVALPVAASNAPVNVPSLALSIPVALPSISLPPINLPSLTPSGIVGGSGGLDLPVGASIAGGAVAAASTVPLANVNAAGDILGEGTVPSAVVPPVSLAAVVSIAGPAVVPPSSPGDLLSHLRW